MRGREFVEAREARWSRLEGLLDDLERHGAPRLDQQRIEEFLRLYRLACADLARVRTEGLGDDVEAYLNLLVARGHKQFRPPSRPDLRRAGAFFAAEFPRAVRRMRGHLLAAALLFVVPTVAAAFAVAADPALAYSLVPPEMLEQLADAYAEGHAGGRSEGEDSLMTGFYVNNNVGIAFRCFATGIFFGLGSMFFLVLNGVFGGAVGAFICTAGHSESFLSFVVGHGAFELTAIVLSGAAGIRLGLLLLNPGPRRRADALARHAPELVRVILGVAAMLLAAALVEGFWSPSGAPAPVKFVVGGGLWTLVLAYLALAGRGPAGDDPARDGAGGGR
jgi:uncharacterized membrane protein SpoIIM required for sporulation